MGKGIGIASFVLLLISLPIPFVGNYLSLFAVLLLCIAAYQREKTWTITVDVLAWVKMFLLSPTWHFMMFGAGYMKGINQGLANSQYASQYTKTQMQGEASDIGHMNTGVLIVTLLILAAPIALLVWRSQSATAPLSTGASGGNA